MGTWPSVGMLFGAICCWNNQTFSITATFDWHYNISGWTCHKNIMYTLCSLQFYTHTQIHFYSGSCSYNLSGLIWYPYCVNWANRSWDVYCLVYLTFVDGKFAVEGKDLLGWAGYVRSILYILSSHGFQLIPYLRNYAQVTSLCHLIWASSVF